MTVDDWLRIAIAVWLVLPGAATTTATELPDIVQHGDPCLVARELIFPLNHAPTAQCHASTLVETPAGVVAAWFGGTHEKHSDVGIWLARRETGTWSQPVEVANGVQSPQQRFACWNPVLYRPVGGELLLFYKVGESVPVWWGMLMRSADHGKNWSLPEKLGCDAKLGGSNTHLIGPVKNKPITLENGTLLCPSSSEHLGWRIHFELTRDRGKTWQIVGPIHDGKEFAAIQPSVLTHPDGNLQLVCRTAQGRVGQSWSDDGGQHWSPISATDLPNPNAGIDAVTLFDGRQLIVYNHATRQDASPWGRHLLNVAVSLDGRKWRPVLTLERGTGEYSYPAVIQSQDGLLHVTYTYERRSIKYVVLDPGKLSGEL